ncbi:acpP [Symbiodinium natans]|uniref:AcpP protein n=1 Tax=Symbiodinium natans TaxID=878477 RepID=A0A812PQG3_9DINO|nr:acpP [Symbiodinium natans]
MQIPCLELPCKRCWDRKYHLRNKILKASGGAWKLKFQGLKRPFKVADVIAGQLGVSKEKVTRKATLESLGAHDQSEVLMALDQAFGIDLPKEDTITSSGQLMDLVEEHNSGGYGKNERGDY